MVGFKYTPCWLSSICWKFLSHCIDFKAVTHIQKHIRLGARRSARALHQLRVSNLALPSHCDWRGGASRQARGGREGRRAAGDGHARLAHQSGRLGLFGPRSFAWHWNGRERRDWRRCVWDGPDYSERWRDFGAWPDFTGWGAKDSRQAIEGQWG